MVQWGPGIVSRFPLHVDITRFLVSRASRGRKSFTFHSCKSGSVYAFFFPIKVFFTFTNMLLVIVFEGEAEECQ